MDDRLTARSRVAMRWSTNPEDMGYGREPKPERLPGKPNYVGSPRTVLAEAYRVQQNVGMGTYIRIEYTHKGQLVREGELENVLYQDEYEARR